MSRVLVLPGPPRPVDRRWEAQLAAFARARRLWLLAGAALAVGVAGFAIGAVLSGPEARLPFALAATATAAAAAAQLWAAGKVRAAERRTERLIVHGVEVVAEVLRDEARWTRHLAWRLTLDGREVEGRAAVRRSAALEIHEAEEGGERRHIHVLVDREAPERGIPIPAA